MSDTELVRIATAIATIAHAGQVDKAGVPYITHPKFVASLVETPMEKCVALLHDTLEDTSLTEATLRELFGSEVSSAVKTMTKTKGEQYFDYIRRIQTCPLARRVKMADLKHNMMLSRITNPTKKDLDRVEKYKVAYQMLI